MLSKVLAAALIGLGASTSTAEATTVSSTADDRVEGNDIGVAGLPSAEGVLLTSSLTVVSGNLVSSNGGAGIVLDSFGLGPPPVGNVVDDDDVAGNATGIVVEDAHVNAITDNEISGNVGEGVLLVAVELNNANGNWLSGNTITDNGSSGVRIEAADENLRRRARRKLGAQPLRLI